MSGYLKVCPVCGKEYEATLERQICCSVECSNRNRSKTRRKMELAKRTCVICLSAFRGATNAKYCSVECEREALRRKKDAEKAKRKRTGTAPSIAAINGAAREEGLSYGLYVAKYGV